MWRPIQFGVSLLHYNLYVDLSVTVTCAKM
jgi:hypothetical protein